MKSRREFLSDIGCGAILLIDDGPAEESKQEAVKPYDPDEDCGYPVEMPRCVGPIKDNC